MQRSDIRTAVFDRLGLVPGATADVTNDAHATSAVMNRLIDRALQQISLRGLPTGWDWLHGETTGATAASTDTYTFEALSTNDSSNAIQWMRIGPLWVESAGVRTELERIPWRDLRSRYETSPEGLPECYAVKGRQVLFGPVPDATYTIRFRYVRNELPLSGDSAEPLLPDEFIDALIEQTCQLWFRRAGNMPMATACAAEVSALVQIMKQSQRPYVGPGRVDDVMYG